jgi:uncharacterized membrane protein YgcG
MLRISVGRTVSKRRNRGGIKNVIAESIVRIGRRNERGRLFLFLYLAGTPFAILTMDSGLAKAFFGRHSPPFGLLSSLVNVIWPYPGHTPLFFSEEAQMGKKIYVGNLAYGVSSSDLQQMFEAHGTVQSAQVIMDRDTGRSKGFGFVEMDSDQEAQAAIAALNGQQVDGRTLTVNEARPREDRGGGGGRGGYGGGGGRGGYGGGGGRGGYGGGRGGRY